MVAFLNAWTRGSIFSDLIPLGIFFWVIPTILSSELSLLQLVSPSPLLRILPELRSQIYASKSARVRFEEWRETKSGHFEHLFSSFIIFFLEFFNVYLYLRSGSGAKEMILYWVQARLKDYPVITQLLVLKYIIYYI